MSKINFPAQIVDERARRDVGHKRHARQDALLSSLHGIVIGSIRRCRLNREQDSQENHAYGYYLSRNSAVWNAQTKNPQGLKTLRIAPASSSSPVPQPSRERWSREPRRGSLASGERSAERFPFRAGLLAHGSSYSPCLPIRRTGQWRRRVSSPLTAAGPRGICTLFPCPNMTIVSGTLGESCIFCQVQ